MNHLSILHPVMHGDNRTMAQLLEAPTEGYEDAIVVPEINANNFEIKHAPPMAPIYQPQVNQPPAYQALVYQAPAPQTQGVSKTDFDSYVKANDAVMRNVKNQGQNLQAQLFGNSHGTTPLPYPKEVFEKMFTKGDITLRVGKEASPSSVHPKFEIKANYNHMTANRIDVIELAL
ncbi:hypothetical protein Tco_0064090 [Tanacetum coccineum]|uniref:Reverse transcriptase domain-containing protein n=1 Tax=Tanacetum coccineum TaxID=301880 RepID=A0ABQ5GAH4_9ASTR